MGFSLSWLAVRGKSTEAVYSQLGVRGTGEREEIPESPIVGASLPGGWSLVVADHDERLASDAFLQPLPCGCEVVACFVEEHVMVSAAAAWKDGHKIWSVSHDSQHGIEHLEAWGELPPSLAYIRGELSSKQQAAGGKTAAVDYSFDVPVELAELLTGFCHHKDIPGASDRPFEVLAGKLPKAKKTSWITRLLGG